LEEQTGIPIPSEQGEMKKAQYSTILNYRKNEYGIQAMFIGKTGYEKSITLDIICGGRYFELWKRNY